MESLTGDQVGFFSRRPAPPWLSPARPQAWAATPVDSSGVLRFDRVGWNQIRATPLMGMNLDRISTEELDSLALAGLAAYVNQALSTLRGLLGKAVGESDWCTAMRYQHPALDSVREAIDQRTLRHKPRHDELRVP